MNLTDCIETEEEFIIYQDLVRDILIDKQIVESTDTSKMNFNNNCIFETDEYSIIKINEEYQNYYIIRYSSIIRDMFDYDTGTYLLYVKPNYINKFCD